MQRELHITHDEFILGPVEVIIKLGQIVLQKLVLIFGPNSLSRLI